MKGLSHPGIWPRSLFPSLYVSYDFKTLKDSKIPTIEYQGKRSEAAILNEATLFEGGSPLQLVRSFDGGKLNKNATYPMHPPPPWWIQCEKAWNSTEIKK